MEEIKIKFKFKNTKFKIITCVEKKKEKNSIVFYSKKFNISGYGKSNKQALKSFRILFKEVIKDFLMS